MKQEIPDQTADHASELQANLKEIEKLYCSVADKDALFLKRLRLHRVMISGALQFSSLLPFLTPEVIAFIGNTPLPKLDLEKLSSKVADSGKYSLWQKIFRCRDLLPEKVLFKIWYHCFNYRSSEDVNRFIRQQVVELPDGTKLTIDTPPQNKQLLADHPLTDPLLLDNIAVQFRTCQLQKPGWKFLRYVTGRGWKTPCAASEMLRNAVKEDDPGSFFIMLDMQRFTVNFSIVMMVVKGHAWNILDLLMQKKMIPADAVTPEELCCHAVSRLFDDEAIALLTVIEKNFPGTIKNTRDDLGRNLLWYLIQNQRTAWFHPDCRLTAFLLKQGCDAENTNTLGLSWRFITESMTLEQKQSQMKRRYRMPNNYLLSKQKMDRLV